MGNDDSDDRIDQLRARVAQLEQQVPDGPTRRQVLAGGGLLGLGGLLGGGATEQVRAQQAAGQVGTSSEPVDVFANDMDAESVSTKIARTNGTQDVTINVPTDIDSLKGAVEAASEFVHTRQNTSIVVNIEAGHTVTGDAIELTDGSYGQVTITSDTTPVPANMNGNLFNFRRVHAPVIDTLFDMGQTGRYGIEYRESSRGYVTPDSGVINAGERGLNVAGSLVFALKSDFSGAVQRPAHITTAGVADLQEANLSGAVNDRNLYLSRSATVNAQAANISNSGGYGIYAKRSWLNVEDADIQNCSDIALRATKGSHVQAENCNVSDSYMGLYATDAEIYATGATAQNCDLITIRAFGGKVNAKGIDASGAQCSAGVGAVYCGDMATVNIRGGNFKNINGDVMKNERCSIVAAQGVETDDGSGGTRTIEPGDTNISSFNNITAAGFVMA